MDGALEVTVLVDLLGIFQINSFHILCSRKFTRNAFLNRGDYNVIIADWGEGAGTPNYVLGE